MLNLRTTQTVEVYGVGEEVYRFTLARFSAAAWQRYSLYRNVARIYACEVTGVNEMQLSEITQQGIAGALTSERDRTIFAIAMDAYAWARIAASLTGIDSRPSDGTWQKEEIPAVWMTPEGLLSDLERSTVLLLDNAVIEVNRRLLGLDTGAEGDAFKKKESESAPSSTTASTVSPNPSTTTTTTSPKRRKPSSPSKSGKSNEPSTSS